LLPDYAASFDVTTGSYKRAMTYVGSLRSLFFQAEDFM